MSAEFALGTFAVLGLATEQGYVRKTALPSCEQTSAGNHGAITASVAIQHLCGARVETRKLLAA